jgi:hypothetical protein
MNNKICDWCGKRPAIYFDETDPFTNEIYPEDENDDEMNWCEECYQDRLDEI